LVKRAAVRLIKTYKTNNPFELAALKNISVIPWNLHRDIKGFYRYVRRNKFIIYNNNIHDVEKSFVCAHELGHAVLHPKENTPFMRANTLFSIDKIEVEANTFAVELLMPDDELIEYRHLPIQDIASIYGVPRDVIHLKKCDF